MKANEHGLTWPDPPDFSFFKVWAYNPKVYGVAPTVFVIEARTPDAAVQCVRQALTSGILLPNAQDGVLAAYPTFFQSRALSSYLAGEFRAEALGHAPAVLCFPDPINQQQWMRYQLSWYGRLWEDIRAWWAAATARPFFKSWFQ